MNFKGDGDMDTKRSVMSWAMYDWANSAYATTVMAGFFPLFFKEYYSAGTDVTVSTAQLGLANSLSSLIVVLIAPLLGAIADVGSLRKRFLLLFSYLGILMSVSLSLIGEGEWEMAAFVYMIGNVGFMMSNSFYDALLPCVAKGENIDTVSGLGFALGYLGGGLLFGLNVTMVLYPSFFGFDQAVSAIKASFVSVAVWWAVFTLPLLFFVEEKRELSQKNSLQITLEGYRKLLNTFKKIAPLKGVLLFLCAYWLYIDGVDTIIRMAVDYAIAIGFDPISLIVALLIVQFVGFPATLIVVKLAQYWETKKVILLAIGIYIFITLFAVQMSHLYEFYFLAIMISLVQGGIQSLSRSYYARMIPAESSAEFFAFYNFLGKFAAILGPSMVGMIALYTGSSRAGIASIVIFFILGGVLLYFVDGKKTDIEIRRDMV